MTRDDIIRLAREAGFAEWHGTDSPDFSSLLERFAKLVAAAERQRCCGIVYGQCESDNVAQRTVDAIRAEIEK